MKKNIPQNVAKFFKKNKATIFACVGAVGVVATAVLSANAALKAEDILRQDKESNADNKTKALHIAPKLIPPVLVAGTTIAFIFMSNAANKKTQMALASAYTLAVHKLTDYKSAVKKVCDEETVKKVEDEVWVKRYSQWEAAAESKICANDPVGKDDELFFDEFSERYFWSTPEKVKDAEYYLNRLFTGNSVVTLNDFYRLLEIEEMPFGDEIGWEAYLGEVYFGYKWIDFEHLEHIPEAYDDVDNPPCCEIFMPFYPHSLDEEELEREFAINAKQLNSHLQQLNAQ